MIRYRYNEQLTPAAPFVRVSVSPPIGHDVGLEVPAQVDTGADFTVIPLTVIESLGLEPLGEVPIFGVGGHLAVIASYLVQIRIHDLPATEIKALASPDEPYVLLGRDVLNNHRIVFDGPNRVLDIE